MSIVKDGPTRLKERRLIDLKRLARLESTMKLVKDRAQFAIEFAGGLPNDPSIISGLVGQLNAIKADAIEALNDA
jgi:hypothetical protein